MPNPPPQQYPLMNLPTGDLGFQELGGNTTNNAKEDMSLSFLAGLIAQAGLQMNQPKRHDDGIDIVISCNEAIINNVCRRHPNLFVQIKATSHPELANDALIFRKLKRDRYVMMTDDDSTIPQALIVYVMPDDRLNWTMAGADHVDFVGHGFYLNMRHAPKLGREDPLKVVLPFANRLTTASLVRFFNDAMALHYNW